MTASFTSARSAAREAAAPQHYPQATLYVVATPIGNLADISLRALHVLDMADTLACEDTRHTQALLRAYGLERPSAQLLAVHQHNEAEATQTVLQRLHAGQRVVVVSDAGTPAISDPGARLVHAVLAAGLRVMPIPGASSVTAALSACGAVPPDDMLGGFVFQGFLPAKATARAAALQPLLAEPRAIVLLEAPHRIEALARELAAFGARPVTLARELTKQFEQLCTVPAQTASAWLAADAQRTKGEFVVVVHPAVASAPDQDHAEADRVLTLLLAELPLKSAVRLAAEITGRPRNDLYTRALQQRANAAPQADDAAPA